MARYMPYGSGTQEFFAREPRSTPVTHSGIFLTPQRDEEIHLLIYNAHIRNFYLGVSIQQLSWLGQLEHNQVQWPPLELLVTAVVLLAISESCLFVNVYSGFGFLLGVA